MVDVSCSDWASLHSRTVGYLEILIEPGNIAPAQADYIIKHIILDESEKRYESDGDPDPVLAIDIWSDLRDIPGYFTQLETLESKKLRESHEIDREALFQKWKKNISFMIENNTIDWSRQKHVFKFASVEECKIWLLGKLKTEKMI